MNLTTIIPILATSVLTQIIILACVSLLTPRVSRPDLFFSVTVDPSWRDSDPGRSILREFNRSVVLYSLLGLVLALIAAFCGLNSVLSSSLLAAGCLTQWVGIIKSYINAHRRVAPSRVAPSTEREALLKPHQPFSASAWLGQMGPFLVLGFVALWLWSHWDRIPVRFPIHWGLDGRPNGWSDRSIGGVFLLPIFGAIVCGFLALITRGVARGVRRVHSRGPEAQREARNLRNMLWVILGVEYWLAVMFGAMGFLPFIAKLNGPSIPVAALITVPTIMSVVIVAVIMLVAVKSGQGGWRLAGGKNSGSATGRTAPVGDRTPDACWKAGIIYYNPSDPAIWVEKRFGFGWTLNMATCGAWVIMGAILLLGLLPLLSLLLLKK